MHILNCCDIFYQICHVVFNKNCQECGGLWKNDQKMPWQMHVQFAMIYKLYISWLQDKKNCRGAVELI